MRAVLDARYLRGRPSGVGAYAAALATRLPRLAQEDRFHFWAHPLAPASISDAPNASQETVTAEPNSPGTLFWPNALGSLAGADVFHCPHNLLGYGIRVPTVVTVHDVMWLENPELIDPWLPRRLVRQAFFGAGIRNALHHATRLLTVSKASADAMTRLVPAVRGRVEVTYNAPDPHFAPPSDFSESVRRAAALLGFDAPYFLVVGQNQPSKCHELALRAFAALSEGREGAPRLVFVQRLNPASGLSRTLNELGLASRVTFLSTLPPDGLVTLMHGALALLQPSSSEGFGMPVIEAMASGCPVLASDIAPLVEVAGGAALHFRALDIDDFATQLRRLGAEPSLRSDLREKGLERARFFSWDKTAEIALETYRLAARRA